ncbi:polysaccharide pyruvyl transferase family protein [Gramella sp. GC03-9]|uniref:Polysaccharide pyruvyl transferase family protein n=1 Tax=Christiangramia oceanisediminis TaxID=2920386 RepID=A0A9X2I5M9_9FLAO|nr:polysaccharide pyruvyl transferase family protein [Gramella oceanisediminis]MCP9198324.1 polysaccharide pyruvyl transferase family protein [Gramella oceanisediminis]
MRLFWYSINKMNRSHPILSKKGIKSVLLSPKENYGDLMSKYLTEKICRKKVIWFDPKVNGYQNHFMVIGSILNFSRKDSIVWGSGIINRSHLIKKSDFRAVRGPLTRKRLLDHDYDCPEIYGDPAILLPEYYNPDIEKKYKLGVVPHFTEFSFLSKKLQKDQNINLINLLTHDIEKVTKEILKCDYIISSSLHGLIVAHAYEIPAIWVKFSDHLYGDDIKFYDYLESMSIDLYNPIKITQRIDLRDVLQLFHSNRNLPRPLILDNVKNRLIQNCPFL